jgi:hypothetical protein
MVTIMTQSSQPLEQPLSVNFSCEERERVMQQYPTARYIFDALALLQCVKIAPFAFTVEPTARIIWGGHRSATCDALVADSPRDALVCRA